MYLARAKALGAEVYALTSSTDKDDDIKKLGGDYIVGASKNCHCVIVPKPGLVLVAHCRGGFCRPLSRGVRYHHYGQLSL